MTFSITEYKLSVLTLNVRGLNNSIKRRKLFHWFENIKADIILLQETFCTSKTANIMKSNWKGAMFNSCTDSNHSRGVAVLFKENLDIKILDTHSSPDGRNLLVNFEFQNNIFSVVSVYAPNIETERIHYFNMLEDWIKNSALGINNLIIGGDFNCTLHCCHNTVKSHVNDKSRKIMQKVVNNLHCVDTWNVLNDETTYRIHTMTNQQISIAG